MPSEVEEGDRRGRKKIQTGDRSEAKEAINNETRGKTPEELEGEKKK